jgi:hypothetical protein
MSFFAAGESPGMRPVKRIDARLATHNIAISIHMVDTTSIKVDGSGDDTMLIDAIVYRG